jgi:hypothetical protein
MEPKRKPPLEEEEEPADDLVEVELAWADEIERRCAELDAGTAEVVELDPVLAKLDRAAARR